MPDYTFDTGFGILADPINQPTQGFDLTQTGEVSLFTPSGSSVFGWDGLSIPTGLIKFAVSGDFFSFCYGLAAYLFQMAGTATLEPLCPYAYRIRVLEYPDNISAWFDTRIRSKFGAVTYYNEQGDFIGHQGISHTQNYHQFPGLQLALAISDVSYYFERNHDDLLMGSLRPSIPKLMAFRLAKGVSIRVEVFWLWYLYHRQFSEAIPLLPPSPEETGE